MTYRIKIVTYNNGAKEYYTQILRWGFWWCGIAHDGTDCWYVKEFSPDATREQALETIDHHYENKGIGIHRQNIEFEYITKP